MKKMQSKVLTIVIPSYNMENYLEKCCDSLLLSENMDKIEVLIINDGSKDRTSQIAHEYENNYPMVFRVIDKENGNYGSCINVGLNVAKGKYIKILDADDRFDVSYFKEYLDCLTDLENIDLVINDYIIVDEEGKEINNKTFSFDKLKSREISDKDFKNLVSLTHHAITWRTDNLRKIGFQQTEGISYTDQEWLILPFLTVNKYYYIPKAVYIYLLGRPGQTMENSTFVKNLWMQVDIKKKMIEFYQIKKQDYPIVNQDCLKYLLLSCLNSLYRHYLMEYRHLCDNRTIVGFDSWLKEKNDELYKESENITFSKRFPVKYIKHWRRALEGYAYKYELIYRFYCLGRSARYKLQKHVIINKVFEL